MILPPIATWIGILNNAGDRILEPLAHVAAVDGPAGLVWDCPADQIAKSKTPLLFRLLRLLALLRRRFVP
jgi:hypothetical protein